MNNEITDRYDTTTKNELILKISTPNVDDLYNDYDKKSSFHKQDLDESLVQYLIQSVDEIAKYPFVIQFYFENNHIETSTQEKIKNSIKDYFNYMQELEQKKMKEQVKNSFIFMLIGFSFVALSLILGRNENFVLDILSEGAMVGGWVSLWEALATLLIKWLPLRKKLTLFKLIASSKIYFP
jgi:hypothetical protein